MGWAGMVRAFGAEGNCLILGARSGLAQLEISRFGDLGEAMEL